MIATKNSFLTEAVLLCKQNCLFFVYILYIIQKITVFLEVNQFN